MLLAAPSGGVGETEVAADEAREGVSDEVGEFAVDDAGTISSSSSRFKRSGRGGGGWTAIPLESPATGNR